MAGEEDIQRTWIQTFDHPHRRYPSANKDKSLDHSAQPSSGSVGKQKVPVVLVNVPYEGYYHDGTRFRMSQKACNNKLLTTQYAPLKLNTANETEADAWLLANNHIVEPILNAINELHPHLGLKAFNESKTGDSDLQLRVDIAVRPTQQENTTPVMLIELKRCWYIRDEEFVEAVRAVEGIEDEIKRIKLLKLKKGRKTMSPSSINVQSNAYPYVQQATAYFLRFKCRFVALCDYEHLILLEYDQSGSLDKADVTIVPRDYFLRTLMGFMMKACKERGLDIDPA